MLYLSKLKAFVHHNFYACLIIEFASYQVENMIGKREDAGYLHLLIFIGSFQKPVSAGSLKQVNVC